MTVADVMACVLAREIRNDDVVGVGLGTPLALCACLLAQQTNAPRATVIVGGAVSPRATVTDCVRSELAGQTAGYVAHLDTMDMAERQAMTLQFLRPAQVGPDGSANTSRVEAEGRLVRFPGGLALADVTNLMPRIVLYHTSHEPRALPPVVAFRTAAGTRVERSEYTARGVTRLVTDRCVIEFEAARPRLASVHAGEDADSVAAATGFPLDPGGAGETLPPTSRELGALDVVDPDGLRRLEFRRPGKAHA